MKYTQHRSLLMVAAAAVSMVVVRSAAAVPTNPFSPSVADIQALSDQTDGFHNGMQLSTIDAIHMAPDGIHLDVTWRVGQLNDPFDPNYGLTFARVSLVIYTNSEDGGMGRLLNPPYDGIEWSLMSDHGSFVQPFVQTAPNWTYYEPFNGGNAIPGDMSLQMLALDFNFARNFITPGTIVHPDSNGEIRANAFGLQLGGPGGLVAGNPVPGHIWILSSIPEPIHEPSTVMLLVVAVVGLARRRLG
jgi:hypothetical protein